MVPISKVLTLKVAPAYDPLHHLLFEVQLINGTKETIQQGGEFLLDVTWADGLMIRRYKGGDLKGAQIIFDQSPKKE